MSHFTSQGSLWEIIENTYYSFQGNEVYAKHLQRVSGGELDRACAAIIQQAKDARNDVGMLDTSFLLHINTGALEGFYLDVIKVQGKSHAKKLSDALVEKSCTLRRKCDATINRLREGGPAATFINALRDDGFVILHGFKNDYGPAIAAPHAPLVLPAGGGSSGGSSSGGSSSAPGGSSSAPSGSSTSP